VFDKNEAILAIYFYGEPLNDGYVENIVGLARKVVRRRVN
jgi:hypothetical protein